ncbi:MAG TPA: PqqD family protein [Candidatus Dormibacteraeota bacterium]|nr:PqqD family protein [Candidatus Dormibacteraeota bacterium]
MYILPSRSVAARILGDEMMIMSAADSTLFSLNSVAAVIWQAADGRTPLSQIVKQCVCSEFAVDEETAYRDAQEFVESLSGHGILQVSDQPLSVDAGAG